MAGTRKPRLGVPDLALLQREVNQLFARLAAELRARAAEEIHRSLLSTVEEYDRGKATDDRTLIVLKRDAR